MADTFYSVILGERGPAQVTKGASTSSEAVELRVADAATGITGNKKELLLCLNAIVNYIKRDGAPL
jgi:hypothetical protein